MRIRADPDPQHWLNVLGELERVGVKVPEDDSAVLAAGCQQLPVGRPLHRDTSHQILEVVASGYMVRASEATIWGTGGRRSGGGR